MKFGKKIIRIMALALTIALLLPMSAYGQEKSSSQIKEEVDKEQNNLDELNTKNSRIDEDINTKEKRITEISDQQEDIVKQLLALDQEILDTQAKIKSLNSDIINLNKEIDETVEKINKLKKQIQENTKLFEERIVIMYKKGGDIAALEVLLASDGINDFLSRQTMMETLADHDKDLINNLKNDKEELDKLEIELNGKKTILEVNKASVEGQKAELESQVAEKNSILDNLDIEEKATKKELEILGNQTEEYKQMIADKIERIRQLEAEREAALEREEAERRKAEEETNKQDEQIHNSNNGGSSNNSSSNNSESDNKFQDAGNTLYWPVPSYNITSLFGPRWGSFHGGLDIAAGMGTPIYAAESGIVTNSGSAIHWSYGNIVTIEHGNGMETRYAHMSSTGVYVGQRVERGQFIGRVGSTGNSTGPHLHFEVLIYGNRVDPLGYL